MVTNKPTKSIKAAAITLLLAIRGVTALTKVSTPPVDFKTIANPAATSITNATYPIIPMPSLISLSILS